jgi:hypothetical protein
MTDPLAPSGVRTFAKSLYVMAWGWLVSIAWLWVAGTRQSLLRLGRWPDDYGLATIGGGVIPALALVWVARTLRRASGAAAPWAERNEWRAAFWWSLVPNLLLLVTVWVMIEGAR